MFYPSLEYSLVQELRVTRLEQKVEAIAKQLGCAFVKQPASYTMLKHTEIKKTLTDAEKVYLLRTALRELLYVIENDSLIPESLSYMKQAREAMEKTA